jgi:hypothetical protein
MDQATGKTRLLVLGDAESRDRHRCRPGTVHVVRLGQCCGPRMCPHQFINSAFPVAPIFMHNVAIARELAGGVLAANKPGGGALNHLDASLTFAGEIIYVGKASRRLWLPVRHIEAGGRVHLNEHNQSSGLDQIM